MDCFSTLFNFSLDQKCFTTLIAMFFNLSRERNYSELRRGVDSLLCFFIDTKTSYNNCHKNLYKTFLRSLEKNPGNNVCLHFRFSYSLIIPVTKLNMTGSREKERRQAERAWLLMGNLALLNVLCRRIDYKFQVF